MNNEFFYDYQLKILNDTSRYINILKSRQIGITYTLSFKALLDCLEKNIDVIIISSNQDNSNNFINFIDRWIPHICGITGIKLVNDANSTKKFSNGNRIICLSGNPRTIGGKSGTVIIDEFANLEDQEAVYNEAKPIMSTSDKYQMIICSAPKGKGDIFYQLCNNIYPYDNYSQHFIDIDDAIKDGFTYLSVEDAHKGLDEDSYQNLFKCQFIDSGYFYFPFALLESNIDDEYNVYNMTGNTFIGVDVGKKQDKTSAVTIKEHNGKYYLKNIEEKDTSTYESRTEFIDSIISVDKPNKVLIDATGIGSDWGESIQKKYPSIVEAVQFTNPFKNEMVEHFKTILENHTIQFPRNQELFKQLNGTKKEVSKSNNIIYTFKRDKTGHSDSAVALMLASFATKKTSSIPQIWLL